MKTKLTLQKRLVLPIVLLGLVTLLSNVLAVFSINNVHANAGTIVDQYMVSEARLEEIRRSMMDIHRLALSHIVAADHATMIRLVQEIKAEEAGLDERLASYREFVGEKDLGTYQSLLENYDSFKHSLVYLVCASADSKTQDAYAVANGDVALWSSAAEQDLDALYASVSSQAEAAQERLFAVYLSALVTSAVTLLLGVLLVAAAFRIVRRYVIAPIRDAMGMLQGSSQRISGVVQEVRRRTETSSGSVRELSSLTQQLSAALEEIASSAAAISGSRYPGRYQHHGGGMRRHHRLRGGYAGTGGGDGTLRPGGGGGGPGQNGGDSFRPKPGHRKEPAGGSDWHFDQGYPLHLLLHGANRRQRLH